MRKLRITAAAVLLLAAACGGGSAEPTATTTPTGGPTTTATGSTTPDTSPTDTSGGGPTGGDYPFESGEGHFEIDGQRFETAYIVSCIVPENFYGEAPHAEDLNLRAFTDDGVHLEVSVSVTEVESFINPGSGYKATQLYVFHHRQGASGAEQFVGEAVNGPDGAWYRSEDLVPQLVVDGGEPEGQPLDPPAGYAIDGDRIIGTLDLGQSFPEGPGFVKGTFDFSIPSEPYDCNEL